MNKNYVFTNHAIDRLAERKIPQSLVVEAVVNPDRSFQNGQGAFEFHKRIGQQNVVAIVKENEIGEKVIVSCWVNPPNPGTRDFKKRQRYLQMQKASIFKKLWLTFLDQIGF